MVHLKASSELFRIIRNAIPQMPESVKNITIDTDGESNSIVSYVVMATIDGDIRIVREKFRISCTHEISEDAIDGTRVVR